MKGLRRNDDAMKNQCWYQKNLQHQANHLNEHILHHTSYI